MQRVGRIGKDLVAGESDSETGLYYYRARYYDQTSGRFLTEDPTRFHAGINFYSYVSNSPVDNADPMGLYQLKGFPPEQAAQMSIAIGELWAKLREKPCCIDPKLRDRLLGLLQPGDGDGGVTFVYAKKIGKGYCGAVGGLSNFFGFETNTILIADSSTPGCGCLPATILHELDHLTWKNVTSWDPEKHPEGLERQCFPSGSSCK